MPRSPLLYTVGGFLVGSAVTIAVNYSLSRRRKENELEKKQGSSLVKTRALERSVVDLGTQRVSFLTEIMAQLWEYINIAASDMIRDTLEPMLVDMTPAITVAKMDLGEIPLRMDNIVVHDIQDGAVKFDMDIIWDGECDIQLKANYVGSFGVKFVKLKGRMSILLKPLTNELPIVSAIQYAFINPPDLKLNFTGLAQMADFKVIHNSIQKMLQDSMASMLVLPNRMLYKMNDTNDFMDTYQPPIGIVYITAVKGRGFQLEKKPLRRHDVPDIYCDISLSASEVWRTRTVKESLTPEWKETHGFLLSDNGQVIRIHAWDEDNGTLDADDDLGTAQLVIGELLLAGRTMEVELQTDGVGTGAFVTLHANVCEFTPHLASLDSLEENTLSGLLTILVTRAFDIALPPKKAACCFVKVTCGSFEFVTSAVTDCPGVDALNPVYDCAFYVPLTSVNRLGDIQFTLINGEDSLGTTTVTAASLVDSTDKTITETRPIGDDGSSLELRVMLRGVQNANTAVEYVAPASVPTKMAPLNPTIHTPVEKPIGTVRITALTARGFKVQKKRFRKDDVPDIYCSIQFGSMVWKTSTIRNSVSPEWNESKEFVLSNHGQSVSIDVFDEDKNGADELLGSVTVTVSKLLLSGAMAEVELESKGKGTGAFLTLGCDMVNPNVRK
jgi:hypothetical protein